MILRLAETPGATYAGIPPQFAYPTAFGDLPAAIPAVLGNIRFARLLVWIFNMEGMVDLIAAIVLATIYGASPYMRYADTLFNQAFPLSLGNQGSSPQGDRVWTDQGKTFQSRLSQPVEVMASDSNKMGKFICGNHLM